jgi:ABC-2 type transport system permease protein
VKYFAFIKVALREMELISHSKFARTLLVFLPLIVYFFLAFIYVKGAMRDIPVAVYDADHSQVSRKVVSMIESSAAMHITKYLSSEDNPERFFLQHDERAVFYIPKGFAKDIYRNKTTRLTVYTNSSNIVYGNILYREAAVIAGTVSAGVTLTRLEHAGINNREAMALIMPSPMIKSNPAGKSLLDG